MPQEIGEFHSRDGFYFKRLPDGSVRIRIAEDAKSDAKTLRQIKLPASEWASVVANVSASGETAESHRAAVSFHGS